jgi:hypothetical protein
VGIPCLSAGYNLQSPLGCLQASTETGSTCARHVQVPKMLGTLRHEWCPQAMVVSFKLETDDALLIKKVRFAAAPAPAS